jgi:phosphate-selective porin OprO/OprP
VNTTTHSLRLKAGSALLAALALASLGSPPLRADEAGDIKQLQAEIQVLQEKLNALASRQEKADAQAAAAAKTAPKVSVADNGLVVTSPDAASSIHVGALVQADSREFFPGGGSSPNTSFILRRARLVLDGRLDKTYSWQFVPEFGNGSGGTATTVALLDANVVIAPTQEFQFKMGKFKAPIGVEELQNDPNTSFVERSFASNLMPSRDVGAEILGNLGGGRANYALGLFNGTPDSLTSSGNSDFDNDKDLDARLFLTPFALDKESPWQGLGFGIGGSIGREKTHAAVTAGYKTDGQQTFFAYNGAVFADGDVWRLSPQAYYYHGPFGALAEYVVSTVNVRSTAPTATSFPPKTQLENKAGQVMAGWVLTGEDAAYAGVTPAHPFNWSDDTWGALQVVARYEQLRIDPKAFVGASPLASPATNASKAEAVGLGLNWYLTKAVRVTQDFFDTRFHVGSLTAATPQILRQNEKALTTRVQVSF